MMNKQAGRQVIDNLQSANGAIRRQAWTDVLVDTAKTYVKAAVATSASLVTTTTTFTHQPDFPRNIVITPGGTTADVPAGDITVSGTNIRDEVISEVFTLTANQTAASTGSKAFKTLTSVVFPIQDGAAATYDLGLGVKLGLDRKLTEASVIDAYVGGVREATFPTVAISSSAIESNTMSTNTAPNDTRDFSVFFITTEKTLAAGTTA
ncbi:hypothetical protein ACFWP5_08815 [Streptomyces sp. NPDC058469]|uniref:hypothetical protein n=1 Tax=Streptomyces sp. NPDC058469 TaxID=3346514 RepID=UPI003662A47A